MKGFDISDDELAKSHARYMVGGCHAVPNERIFRFGMSHPLNTSSTPHLGRVYPVLWSDRILENSFS